MSRRKRNLPSKGKDLKPHQKIDLARQVCDLYSTDQYTLAVCLQQVGIQSDSTWYKWMQEIEEIAELYREAQDRKHDAYTSNLVIRARTRLEQFLDGWTQEIVEQEAIPVKGQEGQPDTVAIVKVKRKQLYIKPSLRAVEFVLTNLDGKVYSRNPEPYKAGNEKMPTKINIEIAGSNVPAITSEDDIPDVDTDRYLQNYSAL